MKQNQPIKSLTKEMLLEYAENQSYEKSVFYEKALLFCEINNKKLLNRIIDIWGGQNSEEIFNIFIFLFHKDVQKISSNYWRSINILSKLINQNENKKYFEKNNKNLKLHVISEINKNLKC